MDQKYYSSYDKSTTTTGVPVSSASESFYTEKSQTTEENSFAPKPKVLVPWSTGLCDCFSDIRNCECCFCGGAWLLFFICDSGCITCWCPCITFGQVSEIVDKGSSSCGANGALYTLIACVTGCSCLYSCFYRSKMRQQYALKDSPCGDCLVHCFCEACALCQEYRELRNRGYDMEIGWHGNMERQNKGGMPMAPVIEGGMSR